MNWTPNHCATVGLLGCGVVGGGVAQRLLEGLVFDDTPYRLSRALVRDVHKPRTPAHVYPFLTTDPNAVLEDPHVDVIVECLGGIEPAATYVQAALRRGLAVVTANKALLADRGAYLEALAARYGTTLRYEAAVGGGMPIVRTLHHYAGADDILEVGGILNGTTNYILSAMEEGVPQSQAIAQAQRAGYAEADPSADLDGIDAAHKLAILAATAFGVWPRWESIARRGIREVTNEDIEFARQRGCRVKLTAWARRTDPQRNTVVAAVSPTFVPNDHPFAAPRGVENIALIVTRHAGPIAVGGLGAGREPTASAIIGDLYDFQVRKSTLATPKETSHA